MFVAKSKTWPQADLQPAALDSFKRIGNSPATGFVGAARLSLLLVVNKAAIRCEQAER